MAIFRSDGVTYTTTIGSDVVRDGFFSELYQVASGGDVFLGEAFWSDATNTFSVHLKQCSIPLSVLEAFLAEARSRVQPSAVPKESNFVMTGVDEKLA